MLDKKRIQEAEYNVKTYLSEGLLLKTHTNNNILEILLTNANESLLVAEEIHKQGISEL